MSVSTRVWVGPTWQGRLLPHEPKIEIPKVSNQTRMMGSLNLEQEAR